MLAETFTTDLEAQMEMEARLIASMMRTDDGKGHRSIPRQTQTRIHGALDHESESVASGNGADFFRPSRSRSGLGLRVTDFIVFECVGERTWRSVTATD